MLISGCNNANVNCIQNHTLNLNKNVDFYLSKYENFIAIHCVSVRIPRLSGSYFPAFSKSPYSVRMRENTDQKNSEYGYFLRRYRQLLY